MHLEFLKLMKKSIGDFKSHEKSTVYLHEPDIDKSDWRFVKKCLEKNFVSTVGNYVNEFEQKLKKQTNPVLKQHFCAMWYLRKDHAT